MIFPSDQSHSCTEAAVIKKWNRNYEKITTLKKTGRQKELLEHLNAPYNPPMKRRTAKEKLIDDMENPPEQQINTSAEPLVVMAEYQGMVMGKYVRGIGTKLQKETQRVHQLQKKVDTLNQTNETLYCEVAQLKEQNAEKKMQNAEMEQKLAETKSKLEEIKTVYKPKNVKRHEETKERKIAQLKTNIEEKVNEAKQLQTSIKEKVGGKFKL